MGRNLASKIVTTAAIASLVLLGLGASPLWADSLSQQPTSEPNFAPYWMTPNQSQTYQQHQQRMAQHQPWSSPGHRGSGGWGHRSHYGRMYDPNSIETITGEVVSVETFTPRGGMSQGVHLLVKTGNETVNVHLGPLWYFENQDIRIQPKDTIEVKGSRVSFTGQSAIIAAQVKKGDVTLILRDESGFPVWSGWRRRIE